ncbi:TetR/AcrR family transcriptional regulator [Aquabacterium humicola]|uniref:TetR/AcrR family transcriptional regulator n=1 Tax=Aquabacterium humicola TaxID=3237377 RepID=UPI0025437F07|nr:TetR family transcriptional regulator [Rubrivivax pictus]
MSDAPPRKSDATKAAILGAAREQFARHGYQGATIRAIAGAAAIDPAMVMRYFGNKEQLFAAAAEFDLQLPDLSALPRAEVGAALVAHFLQRWEADDSLMALLRSAIANEAAAERMRRLFATQVAPAIAGLVDEPRAGVAARAGLVATQMLGLALCRYLLKLPPVVALSRAEAARRIGPTLQAYLFEPR